MTKGFKGTGVGVGCGIGCGFGVGWGFGGAKLGASWLVCERFARTTPSNVSPHA